MVRTITPLQQAYLDAYAAACAQVPRDLRRKLILFGGAASIAHGMLDRKTKDVDILVGVEVLAILDDAIDNRRGGFHRDYDGVIKWNKCYPDNNFLFEVTVELVEIGGPFVPLIPDVVGFGDGFVATLPALVRLRASTLVGRGDDPDYFDFSRLLSMTIDKGLKLPHIGEEELELMVEAVKMCGESRDTDRMFMDILGSFELAGVVWGCWADWALTLLNF